MSLRATQYLRSMVNPTELRRGNWLQFKTSEQTYALCEVVGILENRIFYKSENGALPRSVERFEPIPFTPKLLEKLGFKRTIYEDQDAYRMNLFMSVGYSVSVVSFPKSEVKGLLLFNNATPVGEMMYEYLHQLQNLCFVLTGTELEVNLSDFGHQ
jgi:hypothetical protein